MTDIQPKARKTDKRFLFEVQLNLLEDKLGLIHASDVSGALHVATPVKFGGAGNEWSAEHLLLGSLASSFMSTYLAYGKKLNIEIAAFECQAIGQVKLVNDRYKFAGIDLYPKIFILDKAQKEIAARALKQTEANCIVANSLDSQIYFHSQVIAGKQRIARPAVISSKL